jgi:hypothetical protein
MGESTPASSAWPAPADPGDAPPLPGGTVPAGGVAVAVPEGGTLPGGGSRDPGADAVDGVIGPDEGAGMSESSSSVSGDPTGTPTTGAAASRATDANCFGESSSSQPRGAQATSTRTERDQDGARIWSPAIAKPQRSTNCPDADLAGFESNWTGQPDRVPLSRKCRASRCELVERSGALGRWITTRQIASIRA